MYRNLTDVQELLQRFLNPPDPSTVGRLVVAYDPETSIVEVRDGDLTALGECQPEVLLTTNLWALEPGSYALREYRKDDVGEWGFHKGWQFEAVAGEVVWFNLMDIPAVDAEPVVEDPVEPEPDPTDPEPEPEPEPYVWTDVDVGTLLNGSTVVDGSVITMSGHGDDIWHAPDGFRFRYIEIEGNFGMWMRVAEMNDGGWSAKAGILIRESLDPGAIHAYLYSNSPVRGSTQMSSRAVHGATATGNRIDHPFPMWLRVSRQGNTIVGSVSDRGTGGWQVVDTVEVPLSAKVLVGPAITSKQVHSAVTAKMDGLSFVKTQ